MGTAKKILRKFVSTTAIISLLMLNFSFVVNCAKLVTGEGCCHTQEIITEKISPCCINHLNITTGERISGSCGCSMHEAPAQVDMYNDLYTNQNRNIFHTITDIAAQTSETGGLNEYLNLSYYSPPHLLQNNSFLTNMNLRI